MKSVLAALALSGFLCGAAMAQPTPPPQQPDQRSENRADKQDMPEDPALAKKWVERRIEETVKREERLRAALKDLEKGRAPADVMKDMEPRRESRDAVRDARRTGEIDHNRPDHPQPHKITPEERSEAMKFLHEASPVLGSRFDELAKKDQELTDRILGHMLSRIREAEQAKEKGNDRLYRLRVEEMEGGAALVDAVRAYRDAKNANDAGKLNQATELVRAALARQLDNRLSWQANEIDSLTKRLADMKSDLEKKQAERTQTIDALVAKVRDGKDLRELRPEPEGQNGSRPEPPPASGSPAPRP